MRVNIHFLRFLLAGILIGAFASCKDYQDEIRNANAGIEEMRKKDITELKSHISALQSGLTALQATLANAETSVASLQTDMGSVKTTLAGMKTGIGQVQAELAEAVKKTDYEAFVKTVNTARTNLETLVDGLRTDLTALESAAGKHTSELSGLKTSLQNLQTQTGTLQGKLDALGGRLDTLDGKIGKLQKRMLRSITYVPEFTDGKIAVIKNGAPVTVSYIVAPAEAAQYLEEAFNSGELEVSTMLEGLKTRGNEEAFAVTRIKAIGDQGVIAVRLEQKTVPTDLIDGSKNYSLALRFRHEAGTVNMQTAYTGLILVEAPVLSFRFPDGMPVPDTFYLFKEKKRRIAFWVNGAEENSAPKEWTATATGSGKVKLETTVEGSVAGVDIIPLEEGTAQITLTHESEEYGKLTQIYTVTVKEPSELKFHFFGGAVATENFSVKMGIPFDICVYADEVRVTDSQTQASEWTFSGYDTDLLHLEYKDGYAIIKGKKEGGSTPVTITYNGGYGTLSKTFQVKVNANSLELKHKLNPMSSNTYYIGNNHNINLTESLVDKNKSLKEIFFSINGEITPIAKPEDWTITVSTDDEHGKTSEVDLHLSSGFFVLKSCRYVGRTKVVMKYDGEYGTFERTFYAKIEQREIYLSGSDKVNGPNKPNIRFLVMNPGSYELSDDYGAQYTVTVGDPNILQAEVQKGPKTKIVLTGLNPGSTTLKVDYKGRYGEHSETRTITVEKPLRIDIVESKGPAGFPWFPVDNNTFVFIYKGNIRYIGLRIDGKLYPTEASDWKFTYDTALSSAIDTEFIEEWGMWRFIFKKETWNKKFTIEYHGKWGNIEKTAPVYIH